MALCGLKLIFFYFLDDSCSTPKGGLALSARAGANLIISNRSRDTTMHVYEQERDLEDAQRRWKASTKKLEGSFGRSGK